MVFPSAECLNVGGLSMPQIDVKAVCEYGGLRSHLQLDPREGVRDYEIVEAQVAFCREEAGLPGAIRERDART